MKNLKEALDKMAQLIECVEYDLRTMGHTAPEIGCDELTWKDGRICIRGKPFAEADMIDQLKAFPELPKVTRMLADQAVIEFNTVMQGLTDKQSAWFRK